MQLRDKMQQQGLQLSVIPSLLLLDEMRQRDFSPVRSLARQLSVRVAGTCSSSIRSSSTEMTEPQFCFV